MFCRETKENKNKIKQTNQKTRTESGWILPPHGRNEFNKYNKHD